METVPKKYSPEEKQAMKDKADGEVKVYTDSLLNEIVRLKERKGSFDNPGTTRLIVQKEKQYAAQLERQASLKILRDTEIDKL